MVKITNLNLAKNYHQRLKWLLLESGEIKPVFLFIDEVKQN